MSKPVTTLQESVMDAVQQFERSTGKIVKVIQLIRLDKSVIHRGRKTDLVDIEITIK